MKRKHKTYSKPKKPFDKARIIEEEQVRKEFGLKNKREIWRSDSKIKVIRRQAKNLISASPKEQERFFERLRKIGLKVHSIGDVLSLNKQDYLNRRLQTIIVVKKIARTMKDARQFIVHKKILIDGKIVNSPSYIVPIYMEEKISLKRETKKIKAERENA